MGGIALALAALISYPAVSFGVNDCGYNGAVSPPLNDNVIPDAFCEAGKFANPKRESVKAEGSMIVTPTNPLEIGAPFFLKVTQQPPRFPFAFLPGTFALDQSVLSTVAGEITTGDVSITAGGDIFNNKGVLSIVAPFDVISLKATTRVLFLGDNFGTPLLFPSSQVIGDSVGLSAEKGDIEIQNAALTAFQGSIFFTAPRGNITFRNTVIFSIQDAVNTIGFCRFQPLIVNHVRIGKVNGIVDNPDPTNIVVCIPCGEGIAPCKFVNP
jgi:hypothetical protein